MPRRSSSTPSTPAMESRRQGLQGRAAGGSGGTAVNSRNAAMIDVRNASGGRGPGLPRVPRCRPCRLSRDAVDTYDGRFEYWDAATETAWGVAEPTCGAHERPSRRLAALYEVVACLRGGPIECRGSVDLIRNAGEPHQAAHFAGRRGGWLHPGRARIPDERTGPRCVRPAGRRAGGGPHRRRPPGQARSLRGVAVPGSVGGRARRCGAVATGGVRAPADGHRLDGEGYRDAGAGASAAFPRLDRVRDPRPLNEPAGSAATGRPFARGTDRR